MKTDLQGSSDGCLVSPEMRSLLLVFISLYVVVGSEGLQVEGPSGALQVQLGDSVLLPCSVRTPVPLEELEVEWRRSDSETLVLLFQDGEVRGEEPEFRNRAHFFTEEISRGNFSLFLTDVTPADAGTYRCSVHTDTEYGDATALIQHVERLVVSGAPKAVSARVGDDVTLGCSVDSHVPPEKMEKVVWKRPDQDVIVLLYKGGEVLHDSSHERYRGRAEFFPAEIHKGNFSLRLKEVRTEDEGDFMCEVHTSLLSASTTVLLQDLEMFHVSVPAVLLCLLALAVTVGLSFPVGTSLWKEPPVPSRTDNDQEENHSAVDGNADLRRRRSLLFHCLLVFCPNIILFIAFLLLGVTQGFLGEVVTCSTLNLVRFLLLFKTAPYLDTFPELLQKYMKGLAVAVQYLIVAGVLYSRGRRGGTEPPPVVIVANKKDLEFDRMVSREEGEGLSRDLKLPFHEISARDSWEETLAAFHSVYTNVAQQLEAAPACFRRRTVSRLMEKIPRIHSGSGFGSFRDLLPD